MPSNGHLCLQYTDDQTVHELEVKSLDNRKKRESLLLHSIYATKGRSFRVYTNR
jgi:hypothetical protein